MIVLSKLAEDWSDRYKRGTATYDHIERLKNIGKITEEEFRYMLISKRKEVKNG